MAEDIKTPEEIAAEAAAEAQVDELLEGIKLDPARAAADIRKLRAEAASKINNGSRDEYKRLQEREKIALEQEQAQLVEQGKYKELLETQKTEMETLRGHKEQNDKYNEYFEAQLEEAKKGLSEDLIGVVDSFTGSASDKLSMIGKLKAGMGQTPNALGSDRPASGATGGDVSSLVKQYNDETDMIKKSAMLFELKGRGDAIAKEVLTKI